MISARYWIGVIGFWTALSFLARAQAAPVKAIEELNDEERRQMVIEYLKEGDRYFDQKDYDASGAAYEQVFLLEPQNVIASERIDRLKKQMLKEGKSETALIGRVYGTEIEARTRFYWTQASRLLKEGKKGQARLALEKLLLLDPLHKEARRMYEEIKKADLEDAAG